MDVKFCIFKLLLCEVLLCIEIKAIRVVGRDVTVEAGDDAQLFCQLVETTEDPRSITWQRRTNKRPRNMYFFVITADGEEKHINELRGRVKFTGNLSGLVGSVCLTNITLLDEGMYTCTFTIFPGRLHEREIFLTVLVPPSVSVSTDVPPVPGDTEEILATCTAANSKPAADVSWSPGALNDSVKVQTNTVLDSEGRYTVKSSLIGVASKELNQKKVQCLVTHPALKEKQELNYSLNIHYPPQVVFINLADTQKGLHKFLCESGANPKPTNYDWRRHFPVKDPLPSGADGRLTLQHSPDSNGLYYCVVSNQYGTAVGSIYVDIIPPTDYSTSWTLFIILLVAVCGIFLIWRFDLYQKVIKTLRGERYESVPTNSPEQSGLQ